MRIIFFHNKHEKASRDLLAQLQGAYPSAEIMDFMQAREAYLFQGTPCVWIGGDTSQEEAWQKAVDVTLQDVQDALARVRELLISGATACGIGAQTYTVTALDFNGNPASLPEDTVLTIGDQVIPIDPVDPRVMVTFSDPGIYAFLITGTDCAKVYQEVVVVA